jgi:hypothetical protein
MTFFQSRKKDGQENKLLQKQIFSSPVYPTTAVKMKNAIMFVGIRKKIKFLPHR